MAGSRRGKDGRGEHSRLCVGPDSAAGDPGPRGADLEAGKSAQPSGSSSSRDASDSFLGRLVRIVSGSLGEKDAAAGDERASASKEAGGKAEETAAEKVCLICLESVTQEQLESGEAVYLRCDCKGDVALRHTACAIKWAAVKQSRECDICKAEIQNLPALEDLPAPDLEEPVTPTDYLYLSEADQVPPALDLSFDFLRVTWVATIVCVLFAQLELDQSLWIGGLCGLCYVLIVKVVQSCNRSAYATRAEPEASAS